MANMAKGVKETLEDYLEAHYFVEAEDESEAMQESHED